MTMQLIKPRCLGLISRPYRFDEWGLAIGALSFFSLEKIPRLLLESEQWPLMTKALGQTQVLDMGFAKPKGEVLVAGAAYPSQGQAAERCRVALQVGPVDKSLVVVGDRYLRHRWLTKLSQPQPFSRMPLSYERAYGGPNMPNNPIGRGAGCKNQGTKLQPLANFYYPSDNQRLGYQPKHPAGLGQLDIGWPQRSRYQGTYDEKWLAERHPGFPQDADPKLFLAAAEDQHFNAFIEPQTAFKLSGLHPEISTIAGILPNIRIRMLVQQQLDGALCYREVENHIDTLWLFPDALLGVAIHRGVVPIEDVDGLDIKQLLLACEGVDDPPRSLAHYQQQLAERSDPTSATNSLLNEAPLLPEKTPQQLARRKTLITNAQNALQERKRAKLSALKAGQPELGLASPEDDSELDSLAAIPSELMSEFDYDLSPVMAKVNSLCAKLKASSTAASPVQASKPLGQSNQQLRARLMRIAGERDATASGLSPQAQAEQLQAASSLQMRQLSPTMTVDYLPLPEQQSSLLRIWLQELLAAGESLSGRDLAGANLSGLDFSGQNCRNVMLEGADLSDCNFSSCDLSGAVLTGACIGASNFSKAKLHASNLSATTGDGPCFDGAELIKTQLLEAQLSNASFIQASLKQVNATKAKLKAANFSGAELIDSQLLQTELVGSVWQHCQASVLVMYGADCCDSNWQHAQVKRCVMVNMRLSFSRWQGSRCELLQFGPGGEWQGVNLSRASWKICGLRALSLKDCTASSAVFVECDFSSVQWVDSDLSQSTFYRCLMGDALLHSLDWRASLLHQTKLRKVKASQVDWRGATMHEVDTDHGAFDLCRVHGLKQSPKPKKLIPDQEVNTNAAQ
ncbi:DUF2169 domain-containing protein [Agarivorans sp. Z349TD_8]|uniref:DUF2169 domain-containing protein n=1 Tax=Agarivorans sp. Z349TD_8 TaxID=3421434 RepID=UPI003D7C6660